MEAYTPLTHIEQKLLQQFTEPKRNSLGLIREAAEDIWRPEKRIIGDYTDHGIMHSQRVVYYADTLLAVHTGVSLSAEEKYLLLAGIYLHDIGMQCDVVKHPKIKAKAQAIGADFGVEFSAQASSYSIEEQKAIRENHHLLTAAWIDYARHTGATALGPAIATIPDELVTDLIDVCKYHAKLPITECPLTFTFNELERKRLVAALVRFTDELDVDSHRVSIETVKNFNIKPQNAIYWWLHNLTKVVINGNLVTLIIRLKPKDKEHFGELVHKTFIERFRLKNRSVLTTLASNGIPIVISEKSSVVEYDFAEKLPDEIASTLINEANLPPPRLWALMKDGYEKLLTKEQKGKAIAWAKEQRKHGYDEG